MTTVYFVRHAQPVHSDPDDRNRPLTAEGLRDTELVLKTLKDKRIDHFYCSPYRRSIETIKSTAEYFGMPITTDERLREREVGDQGNIHDLFRKRWEDHSFHEPNGESIGMVQQRNIEALLEILEREEGRNIVIGTHGTALSSMINYFDSSFGCDDFLRIIDWMPYIVQMDFEKGRLVRLTELAHLNKEFSADIQQKGRQQ